MDLLIKFYTDIFPLFDWVRCSDDVKDFIICQFALESSFGKSRLAHDCNNYCGMRYPRVRISTCVELDKVSGMAKYPSLYYCVVDYFLACQYHRPFAEDFEDLNKFKFFISKWYCLEKDYIDKINKLFNQLKSYKNECKN